MTTERQIRLEQVRNQANVSLDVLLANNVVVMVPCSSLQSTLATGGNLAYFQAPKAFTLTAVQASLLQASNGGNVQIQITGNGSNLLSTVLQIDNATTTSVVSIAPPVISNTTIVANEVISYNCVAAGANALGLIVTMIGYTNETVGN
jgi:hypothetical protein